MSAFFLFDVIRRPLWSKASFGELVSGQPSRVLTISFANRSSHLRIHPWFGALGSFHFSDMGVGTTDQCAVEKGDPFLDRLFLADGDLQIFDSLTELGPVDILYTPLSLTAADGLMVHRGGNLDAYRDMI